MMGGFSDLDYKIKSGKYPDAPGYSNNSTSKAAAKSMIPHAGKLQMEVLKLLHEKNGLTADEVQAITGWRIQSITARIRELVLKDLAVDSGETRIARSEREVKIWKPTEMGAKLVRGW